MAPITLTNGHKGDVKPKPARKAKPKTDGEEEEDMKCADVFGSADSDDDDDGDKKNDDDDEDYCIEKDLQVEESRLRKVNDVKMRKEEEAERMRQAEDMSDEQRYSKVIDLLKKSEFYSNFLLEKIEGGDDAKSLKNKRLEERRKAKEEEDKKNNVKPKGKGKVMLPSIG
jgi:hypothetical protein